MGLLNNKKQELRILINNEHGKNYHRNIKLSGYTIYREDSFITFHFVNINKVNTVVIDYIYITGKNDLLKLLSFCIKFWAGNNVGFVYYKEHKRQANYVKTYFESLGFKIVEQSKNGTWKYPWTSTNGFNEDEILEAFI